MITIDHVIESYLLAAENRPLWAHKYTLLRFMRRWPEHAAELVEFLALSALIDSQE